MNTARRSGIHFFLNNGELQLKFSRDRKIDPELLQEIKDNKTLIADFLNNDWKATQITSAGNEIQRFDREVIKNIPLSFSQERLWFIHKFEGSIAYHMPVVLRLKGKLDKQALHYALQLLLADMKC
jgi:hypothetical protein